MGNCFQNCFGRKNEDESFKDDRKQDKKEKKSKDSGNCQTLVQVAKSCRKREVPQCSQVSLTTKLSSMSVSDVESVEELSQHKTDHAKITTSERASSNSTTAAFLKPSGLIPSPNNTESKSAGKSRVHGARLSPHFDSACSLEIVELSDEANQSDFTFQPEEQAPGFAHACHNPTERPAAPNDSSRAMLELLKVRVDMAANNMEINSILRRLEELSDRTIRRVGSLKRPTNAVNPADTKPDEPNDKVPPRKPRICWE